MKTRTNDAITIEVLKQKRKSVLNGRLEDGNALALGQNLAIKVFFQSRGNRNAIQFNVIGNLWMFSLKKIPVEIKFMNL